MSRFPHEPMTERQARYLRELCERDGRTFDPMTSKADARELIAELANAEVATPEKVRAVACPGCGAPAGEPCVRENHHQARVNAAQPHKAPRAS